MSKIVVITGASSGIGLSAAKLFSDKGYTVCSLSRRKPDDDRIIHIKTDVTDEDSVKSAFSEIANRFKKIDILVCNAGMGISGACENTSLEDAKLIFGVNFFGVFLATKYVLPYMRKQGSGRIVAVSSVAAVLPVPYQSFYSSTKSALNAYMLALANEVKQFGITVCCIMPGDVSSGFTSSRRKSNIQNNPYSVREERAVSLMEKDEQNGMTSDKIGRRIFAVATKKHPKLLSSVGFSYRIFALLAKILPTGLVNKLEGKMYG